jgi:hypothetical protein
MLLPRCNPIHSRLRRVLLLRDFHATRAYLRTISDSFQIEPTTPKTKVSRHTQPRSDGRKSGKRREGKRKERKGIREGRPSSPTKLSSLLRLHDKSAPNLRTSEGTGSIKFRTLRGHLGASEDSGLPYFFFYVVSSHLLPSTVSFSRRWEERTPITQFATLFASH